MRVRDRPILSDVYEDSRTFRPVEGSAYVYGYTDETRSSHVGGFEGAADVDFVRIRAVNPDAFATVSETGTEESFTLHSKRRLREFWDGIGRVKAYIDITGLEHHLWAPLLKSALEAGVRPHVVYVEPKSYRSRRSVSMVRLFDLSEEIEGLRGLPGFVTFRQTEDDVCFVPLLGFEGARLQYCYTHVDPPLNKTVPVVGAPGFAPEYPFYTLYANKTTLEGEEPLWSSVRYATASCPFSLYYLLEDIAADYPGDLMKVALIGTKPHALGAVLYAIANGRSRVELIYDWPKRKPGRTSGAGRLHVYHVYELPLSSGN